MRSECEAGKAEPLKGPLNGRNVGIFKCVQSEEIVRASTRHRSVQNSEKRMPEVRFLAAGGLLALNQSCGWPPGIAGPEL